MRIDLNHEPQPIPESNRSGAPSAAAASHSVGSTVKEDQAQFSGAHVQVEALAAQVLRLPEVREERVRALRQAIQSGQNPASPGKVASALFVHMIAGPAA